ncbi:MAG TPA: DUF3303 family protein [Terriglobales bacterium]|nr:DUF3303 family protein [Terriglobales bacterium]
MKFMLTFTMTPDKQKRNEAIARFLKTGGQPPKGAKLIGRWTRLDFSQGYDLLESDDPKALTEFALAWNDVMQIEIVPVIKDQGLSEVLKLVAA